MTYKKVIAGGIIGGILCNIHPSAILPLGLFCLGKLLLEVKPVWSKIASLLLFGVAFGTTILPVLIFEVRHEFVIVKSVLQAIQASNSIVMHNVSSSALIPASLFSRNLQTFSYTPLTNLGIALLTVIVLFLSKKGRSEVIWTVIIALTMAASLILGGGVPHYYFAPIILAQLIIIWLIWQTRYRNLMLLLLICANILVFPKQLYSNYRNLYAIEKAFPEEVVEFSRSHQPINVVLVNDSWIAAVGYEYRYLLAKNGVRVLDEFSYNVSEYLLIVSEKGSIDAGNYSSWEVGSFGPKRLITQYNQDLEYYYFFRKE